MVKNRKWKIAVIDYLYSKDDIHKNIIAHVKLIHNNYYEILVPEFDFKRMYIESKKIVRFL